MKLIDMHSHWGTKRGYTLRSAEELALTTCTWNTAATSHASPERRGIFCTNGEK